MFAWAQPAAATPPSGFQETIAFSGLTNPTAISFAPNGRIFVGEKSGVIKVYDGLGDSNPTTTADLNVDVYNFWDRGLLGMTVDPQFPTRPYLYVLYSRDAEPGGNSPRWGTAGVYGDPCPNPPGATGDGCLITGRLARLTLNGSSVMTAQTNLITDWCQQYPSHSTGDLAFGSDGALYVSGGDGASFTFTDWGQGGNSDNDDGSPLNPCADPPGVVGSTLTPPDAEGGALRSQDLRTTGDPTTLNGSVLRVNPDTGAGVSGNPFAGSTDANLRRIIAFGQRNPFRFTIRPGTNEVWSGDVGWSDWEEINRLVDPGGATADNFGWPCYEGTGRQGGYDGANLNICENLYNQGSGAWVTPYYTYNHGNKVVSGETCPTGSSSISGLGFYQTGPFPNSYNGALFFADYSRDCIWAITPGTGGLPNTSSIQTFNPGAANPVDLEISPQGELFYADLDGGTIRRIFHTTGNAPPNAVATATPSNGATPLTTTLSASSSTDPNGDTPLSYTWDLDEDGQFDDSTQVSVQRTYTQPGTYDPAVRVSDPDGASDTDSVQVQAGNTPPSAQITTPTSSDTWGVGDLVQFSGSATDSQQPTLPDSAFDWRIVINHCPSNCHQHTMQTFADTPGASFNAPDHEYPSSLTIELTATDAGGLTDTESITINPRTVQLTLNSNPTGLRLGFFNDQTTAPFTRTVIEDSLNSVSAPSPQTLGAEAYQFQSWSDGGAASHNTSASASQTFTATYEFSIVPPPLAPLVLGKVGGSPRRCGGAVATEVGTAGKDRLTGSAGRDVLVGLGGNDELIGKGGKDVLCGRGGDDRLSGGAGPDKLIGGGGRDACNGGKGPDKALSCEGRKR
jgi:glucose/arabinose dehydrogenase